MATTKETKDEAAAKAPANGTVNGIMVTREYDPQGNLEIQIKRSGNVQLAELPTLLAFAERLARQQLGIGD